MANYRHGWFGSPEYKSWDGMIQHCYNPNSTGYKDYGGRGITVCNRWRNDFVNFLNDLGKRPTRHTLGRIDNEGNYEPNNCEWQLPVKQMRNTRRTKLTEVKVRSIREMFSKGWTRSRLAKHFNVSYYCIVDVILARRWKEG